MQITLSKLEQMTSQELTVLIQNMDKRQFEALYIKIKSYPVGQVMRVIFDKIYTKPETEDIKDVFKDAGLGDFFNGFRK